MKEKSTSTHIPESSRAPETPGSSENEAQELENWWYEMCILELSDLVKPGDPPLVIAEKHAIRRYVREVLKNRKLDVDPFNEAVSRWLSDYGIDPYQLPPLPGELHGRTLNAVFESATKQWVINELSKARRERIKPFLDEANDVLE